MSASPNQESFNNLWNKVIKPEIERYLKVKGVSQIDDPEGKIWEAYKDFNLSCRRNFMSKDVEKLDRHKVAACYIYAVVKTQPLSMKTLDLPEDMVVTINEHLAITVGMSILYTYIQEDSIKLDLDGLKFPEAKHGQYRDDFALELHYTKKHNMYNILSLSNTLFLLEMYNLSLSASKKDAE